MTKKKKSKKVKNDGRERGEWIEGLFQVDCKMNSISG